MHFPIFWNAMFLTFLQPRFQDDNITKTVIYTLWTGNSLFLKFYSCPSFAYQTWPPMPNPNSK